MPVDGVGAVAERGIYLGHGLQGVDAKGRVAIPSALRQALAANAAEGDQANQVIVATHETSRCLIGYDPGYSRQLAAEAKARQAASVVAGAAPDYNIARAVLGLSEPTPFDGSGRFVLPDFPRFYAGIEGHAFFFGQGDYFEIWNPRTLIETADAPDQHKEAARFFMKQKGVAL